MAFHFPWWKFSEIAYRWSQCYSFATIDRNASEVLSYTHWKFCFPSLTTILLYIVAVLKIGSSALSILLGCSLTKYLFTVRSIFYAWYLLFLSLFFITLLSKWVLVLCFSCFLCVCFISYLCCLLNVHFYKLIWVHILFLFFIYISFDKKIIVSKWGTKGVPPMHNWS